MATGIKISNLTLVNQVSSNSLIPIIQDGQTLATSVSSVAAGVTNLQSTLIQGNTTTENISSSNKIFGNEGEFYNVKADGEILSGGENIKDVISNNNSFNNQHLQV